MGPDPVASMLDKLSEFSRTGLDGAERAALGALLAPGIAWALEAGAEEVEAFGYVMWTPDLLADRLRRALETRPLPPDDTDRAQSASSREHDPDLGL